MIMMRKIGTHMMGGIDKGEECGNYTGWLCDDVSCDGCASYIPSDKVEVEIKKDKQLTLFDL